MADIFSNMFDADMLESAVRNLLRSAFPTYLREKELRLGMPEDSFPPPKSYLVAEEVDKEVADQLPAVVVVSPGLAREPVREGNGQYRAAWNLSVAIFAQAGGSDPRQNTIRLLRRYLSLARSIILDNGNFLGVSDEVDELPEIGYLQWLDENYDGLTFSDTQTIAAGETVFEVEVTNVVRVGAGPMVLPPSDPDDLWPFDPETQPGSQWPTGEESEIIVIPVPITEEV